MQYRLDCDSLSQFQVRLGIAKMGYWLNLYNVTLFNVTPDDNEILNFSNDFLVRCPNTNDNGLLNSTNKDKNISDLMCFAS